MVTKEQAREYIDSQGIDLPDVVLNILVEQANDINECLTANYPASTATLIQLYLIGLLAYSQNDKYISSQTAVNGASVSYKYQDFEKRWRAAYNLLRTLDKKRCTADLVPEPPYEQPKGGIWIGRAGKMR